MYGRRLTSMPNDNVYEIQSTNRSLARRARHQRNVMQQFTNRWRKEYERMILFQLEALLLLKTVRRIAISGNWL